MRRSCRPADIPFETTADAETIAGVVGQERAVEALRFGIGVRRHGYNLFAVGPSGVGKQTLIGQFLDQHARKQDVPPDLCYVHDFDSAERPRALELPPGVGARFSRDMDRAITNLRHAMRDVFESDEYRARKQELIERIKERQDRSLGEIRERAKAHDVAVLHTEGGIAIAPIRDGSVLEAEKFHALPPHEQEELHLQMERVGGELHELLQRFNDWGREHHEAVSDLDRQMAAEAARLVLDRLRERYRDHPAVLEHLEAVELDVVESADDFLESSAGGMEAALRRALRREQPDGPSFERYRVNLLVDRSGQRGAPVVYEDNPNHANLIGRIEHETQFGALITNFTLIRAGALHRAAGGYLVIDALKLLQHPYAWEALKRTIRSGQIEIESLGQAAGLVQTVSLEPEPVALGATKIVLTGERRLYTLLAALDPDFLELFKVLVDFEETMDRGAESQQTYAKLVASLVDKEELRPFDRGAVARVIDQAARAAGDAEKLSVGMRGIVDLLREADYWAGEAERATATEDDVQHAIDAQLYRSGRVRQRLQEAIRREDILVSTSGASTGQVNGLSVLQLGGQAFGHPTRITARVRLGKGELVDIEREVELGGPIHSKGVLILGGFLGSRYATRFPLSLSASLVFEQSYAGVEGDSASLAELCALLSALAEVPLRQSLAITGSVNQQGQAQSVGGVNEKIEGFFDICAERGLTGDQGVIIPRTNAKNLMLRRDVVEAVEAGRFHVHAVETVDDAMELLTGEPAPHINDRVESRLASFAARSRHFLERGRPRELS